MQNLKPVELLAVAAIAEALMLDAQEPRRKRKWVHEAWKTRETEGEFATLYKHLEKDEKMFHEYYRMTINTFNILLNKISHKITKKNTHYRQSISPRLRLTVCLRFLATGDAFNSLRFRYKLGHSTVWTIVHETCEAIIEEIMPEVMPTPSKEMWETIADNFHTLWNFPNCLGALDGKHVNIFAPPNSGSLFFNYKKTFSIVLMSLVDAEYNFIAVDVGAYGKNSDGGIFSNSNLGKALEGHSLNIPEPRNLPNTERKVPFVIVADEAFPLKENIMRPFPGHSLDMPKRIFNYRLSRARRIVENAFGILSQRFRIYFRQLQAEPKYADKIVLTTCILHNFINKYDRNTTFSLHETQEKMPYVTNLPPQGGNASKDAFEVRNTFKDYFNSQAGSVPWQASKVTYSHRDN